MGEEAGVRFEDEEVTDDERLNDPATASPSEIAVGPDGALRKADVETWAVDDPAVAGGTDCESDLKVS